MRAALAILAVALVAVPAADGYRNPTAGKALVLQISGMHRAKVKRNVVYQRSPKLRMDIYRPRRSRGRLPAVLLGGPPGSGRTSGQKVGWAQLIAASGLSAVAFDIRSDGRLRSPRNPALDVQSAIAYVRSHSKRLGIDPNRLCTLGFSAPWHLWATMRDPRSWLRCNVVYYEPLDFQSPALGDEFSALTYLRRSPGSIPPMLVLKAGRDANAGINESIDRFQAAATELHADVRVVTDQEAAHGFDIGSRTARARAIVKQTLRFLKARLAPPLPVTESCATKAENGLGAALLRRRRHAARGRRRGQRPSWRSYSHTDRTSASASGFPMRASSQRPATASSRTTRDPGFASTPTSPPRSKRFGGPGRRT